MRLKVGFVVVTTIFVRRHNANKEFGIIFRQRRLLELISSDVGFVTSQELEGFTKLIG
jgi:hypothetical protein